MPPVAIRYPISDHLFSCSFLVFLFLGSICLLLQVSVPIALFAPSPVFLTLKGYLFPHEYFHFHQLFRSWLERSTMFIVIQLEKIKDAVSIRVPLSSPSIGVNHVFFFKSTSTPFNSGLSLAPHSFVHRGSWIQQ